MAKDMEEVSDRIEYGIEGGPKNRYQLHVAVGIKPRSKVVRRESWKLTRKLLVLDDIERSTTPVNNQIRFEVNNNLSAFYYYQRGLYRVKRLIG